MYELSTFVQSRCGHAAMTRAKCRWDVFSCSDVHGGHGRCQHVTSVTFSLSVLLVSLSMCILCSENAYTAQCMKQ